ncbi:RNA recognition motif domain-containing protein [Adhaeretor mobilis]|uniref:RNA recognition motif domain-containing protein n=1 Tax=Adhaeretor mobilis TaxID=1930276 RepID=UPI001FE4E712|nr:RNA-binding protein [Adhaeretor mobilis]
MSSVFVVKSFRPRVVPDVPGLKGTGFICSDARGDVGVHPMKLYVGNLSYNTTQETLEAAFAAHGDVGEVAIINDRETGRPRGFAFVTMTNDDQARTALEAVNGLEIDGRTVTVNEARPKPERSRR